MRHAEQLLFILALYVYGSEALIKLHFSSPARPTNFHPHSSSHPSPRTRPRPVKILYAPQRFNHCLTFSRFPLLSSPIPLQRLTRHSPTKRAPKCQPTTRLRIRRSHPWSRTKATRTKDTSMTRRRVARPSARGSMPGQPPRQPWCRTPSPRRCPSLTP